MSISALDFLWCNAPDLPDRETSWRANASDADLIDRIRQHDEAAYETLVRDCYDRLVHFAVGLTHSSDSARDIVQDVFAWIWAQGTRWQPRGSLMAYLFAAVRNAAINRRAHSDVERRYVERESSVNAESPSVVTAPDNDIEHAEQMAALQRAVASLTERQRSAFELRYQQHLTVPEVAQALGISPKGAERLLTRVIATLRSALAHLR